LSLKQGQVFKVMACAYRHDVLDKFLSVLGDAIDGVMRDADLGIGDLVNKLDEAGEQTVMKLDGLIARSGPMLRFAAMDRVMAAVSRLMDVATVRKAMVAVTKRMLVKAVTADRGLPGGIGSLEGGRT
jgi:NADP-dependent 3-hydroxy acid dehydrogenase YdfG